MFSYKFSITFNCVEEQSPCENLLKTDKLEEKMKMSTDTGL